jgi:hypothetical protein
MRRRHYTAHDVLRILERDLDEFDSRDRGIMVDVIARQLKTPSDMFELIVDAPGLARWRLHWDRNGHFRLGDHSYHSNPQREAIERNINNQLAALR